MRFDRLLFINKNGGGGSNRRTTRLNQPRSISSHSLQNLLMGGILAFSIGIFVMYTHLMKIESNVHTELADGRLHYSSANKKREGTSYINKEDPNSWFHKNNNHHNPGRAYGSERGKVKCDQDIYKLVSYWNDPRSIVDREFESPFLEPPSPYIQRPKKTRYLSFEPDLGGWNNIRMEFEIMVLLAAATGRTLVLPPDNPLYLLSLEKKNKHRGLQNFFHDFSDVVETISTEDFFQKEIIDHSDLEYQLPMDEKNRTRLLGSLEQCYWMKKHDHSCIYLYEYMKEIADFIPNWHGEHNCLIMDDENWFKYDVIGASDEVQKQRIKKFCANRTPIYYNNQMHGASLIHFHSHNKDTRLLVHFYAFIYFTNPKIGNYYKRLVRDRVRYSDEIQCAAGKIVRSLIEESMGRYFNGAGAEAGYFSMHIRRGDFQWPKMRISAEEWHENTRIWLEPDDQHLLYIATDETDRDWFKPLMKHYKVRFLDDFAELAGLSNLDPNFVGMIDQIVASKGRDFVGTYFSSFSAYIGRIRGYHGLSGKRMFYSHPQYWNETHSWVYPHASYSAREYPLGWLNIDKDEEPSVKYFY